MKGEQTREAEKLGLEKVKDHRFFSVYLCSKAQARELKLTEDIILSPIDLRAAQVIGADRTWVPSTVTNSMPVTIADQQQEVDIFTLNPCVPGAIYKLYATETLGAPWGVLSDAVATQPSLMQFSDIKVRQMRLYTLRELLQFEGNTGFGRKVAVLDTGIEFTHPELSSSYLGGYDFYSGDNDPSDEYGHGTITSGIITADGIVNPLAKGVAPDVGIYMGKITGPDGGAPLSCMMEGIYWAADKGDVDAISISFGGGGYSGFCDVIYPALEQAIQYAHDRNVSVVIAAGNNSTAGVSFPGCMSQAFTVGATSLNGLLSSFSGRGEAVDIAAPGENLLAPYKGGGFVYCSGTSLSAPEVAGIMALMKARKPNASYSELEAVLKATAKPLTGYAYGRVDAYRAITSFFGQANFWTNTASAPWDGASWSLGILPNRYQNVYITSPGWKAVDINPLTRSHAPDSLTVSNLTISAPANAWSTLLLNYIGDQVPFCVLNQLEVGSNASLVGLHSDLMLGEASTGGLLHTSGEFHFEEGVLRATNSNLILDGPTTFTNAHVIARTIAVGLTGGGTAECVQEGGVVSADSLSVGSTFLQGIGGDLRVSSVEVNGVLLRISGHADLGSISVKSGSISFEASATLTTRPDVTLQSGTLRATTNDLGKAELLGDFALEGQGELRFEDSSTVTWNPAALLSVSLAAIRFGTDEHGLREDQVFQLRFKNPPNFPPGDYPGKILATGYAIPVSEIVQRTSEANVELAWPTTWILQRADSPDGPFADVPDITMPYVVPAAEAGTTFFRLRPPYE